MIVGKVQNIRIIKTNVNFLDYSYYPINRIINATQSSHLACRLPSLTNPNLRREPEAPVNIFTSCKSNDVHQIQHRSR
jgi:hypothetical protein